MHCSMAASQCSASGSGTYHAVSPFQDDNQTQSIIIHYLYLMATIVLRFEDKLPFIFVLSHCFIRSHELKLEIN